MITPLNWRKDQIRERAVSGAGGSGPAPAAPTCSTRAVPIGPAGRRLAFPAQAALANASKGAYVSLEPACRPQLQRGLQEVVEQGLRGPE